MFSFILHYLCNTSHAVTPRYVLSLRFHDASLVTFPPVFYSNQQGDFFTRNHADLDQGTVLYLGLEGCKCTGCLLSHC